MLVIISDLHLTDGTSGNTIRSGAFRAFHERIRDLAYDASFRADGTYKPLETVDLVLLGDVLDVIRSTKWLDEKDGDAKFVRPWHDSSLPSFSDKIRAINDGILAQNKESLQQIKKCLNLDLPPAQNGHPELKAKRVPVKVSIYYLVGNHDWFYHLPNPVFNPIRKAVVDAMGLANSPNEPFPHDPVEAPYLIDTYERHNLFARHGDIYDAFNYGGNRNESSLGDAIVIDLLNRFPHAVNEKLGKELPADCLAGLNEIDNVRPVLMIPMWIDGLLRRTCSDRGQINAVKRIWDGLADEFLESEFVRKQDSWLNPLDAVDKLQCALKFSKGLSMESMSNALSWFSEKFGIKDEPFYKHALREQAFKNRRARFIIYGHTHHQEIIPLDVSNSGSRNLNQMYFNSGTWRQVHEQARLNPDDREFIGYHVLTYLAFFKGDERGGRPFECWSGALGV